MQPANEVTRIARVFAWLAILLGAAVLGLYVFASVIVFRLGPQQACRLEDPSPRARPETNLAKPCL